MIMLNPIGNNIQDFKILGKIGFGGCATVYKAVSLLPGYEDHPVAIKKIEKRCNDIKHNKRIRNEIKIHRVLLHPSIVKFHGSFEDENFVYLVLELCEGGTLEKYIEKNGRMPESKACRVIKQLIGGVTYLHTTKSILHRDLSLKNILLTSDMDIKIADFGMASELKYPDEQKHSMMGTENFISPELASERPYGLKADCWAVGCISFALLYGRLPFKGKTFCDTMKKIVTSPLLFPLNASTEARELLENLLSKDPDYRINIQDSLKYPFFKKFDKSYGKNYQRNEDSGLSSFSSSNSSHKNQRINSNRPNPCRYDPNNMLNECVNCEPSDNQILHISRNTAFHESQQKVHGQGRSIKGHASINHLKNKLQTLPSKQPLYQRMPHRTNFECDQTENWSEREVHNIYQPQYNANRFESQVEDFPVENHCNSPLPYPSDRLQNIVDDQLYSNSYHNIHNQQYQEYVPPTGSCSHEFHCTPENNCAHNVQCCCRQSSHRNDQSQKSSKKRPKDVKLILQKNPGHETLESVVKQPLTTLRLLPRRFIIKNVIVHILSDGQVCLESLKEKRNAKYVNHVCYISEDGQKIRLFKPKEYLKSCEQPPPLPNNFEDFDFKTLPPYYWNRYQYAKKIIDIVRAKTPKITIYGRDAKCVMMENLPDPDYEVNFNNGCSITQIDLRVACKDQNGSTIDPTSDMLEVYTRMKKRCQELEICLKRLSESNSGDAYFPVVIGRRLSISLNRQGTNKSAFSHNSTAIKEAVYEVKPYESITNLDSASCHSRQNSLQRTAPLKNNREFERYTKSAKR